jgi:RimJ/RimL family protein N-acetyltransferase
VSSVSSPELRTERLRLLPLDAAEMRLFAEDWPALQRHLGARPSPAWVDDRRTLAAARRHRRRMLRDPGAWLWWTFWQVVLASEGVSIGLVDFKGPPGPEGRISIGFSLAPPHWNRGYATEAVGGLVAWAVAQPGVRAIEADTEVANVRSHRVLEKMGFVPTRAVAGGMARHGATRDLLVWHLASQGWATPSRERPIRPRP